MSGKSVLDGQRAKRGFYPCDLRPPKFPARMASEIQRLVIAQDALRRGF